MITKPEVNVKSILDFFVACENVAADRSVPGLGSSAAFENSLECAVRAFHRVS